MIAQGAKPTGRSSPLIMTLKERLEEFVADNVIVLRNVLEATKRHRTLEILKFRGTSHQYVEMYGEMQRGITVLKMQGSPHDKDIRRFTIDGNGMHIGKPFRNVTGILSGQPIYTSSSELERIEEMFAEERKIV